MTLYTVGYGGRSPDQFLDVLHGVGIRTVVDVRLRPDRASMGVWTKAKTADKGIEPLLRSASIDYRSLPELGNFFLDAPDWRERYRQLLERAGDLLVARLAEVDGPVCLMCAEKKASDCHRQLIAEYLARTTQAAVKHLE